jgi:DNA repair protein RadC
MVLGHHLISEGSVTSANIPTRTVMEKALVSKAVYVVLAHNHPGGLAIPSPEDEDVTMYLKMMLQGVGVILLDHVIVSDRDYVSLMSREAQLNKYC